MLIRFYRKRGGDAECYRAVQWPESETDQDAVIKEVRRLLGTSRPGAALIGRDLRNDSEAIIAQAEPETCGVYADTVSRNWVTLGAWIVIPQDVGARIFMHLDGAFNRYYVDAMIIGGRDD